MNRFISPCVSALSLVMACSSGDAPGGEGGAFDYQTSPADGEAGVATTRETLFYFDAAVDPSTIDDASLTVSIDGREVDATIYVFKDERRAGLFYPGALPGDARVTVTIDGDRIRSKDGLALDGDRDGIPGGLGTFSFDTVSLRPVPGTDACGRVFASELDDGGLSAPLAGVRVSVDGASDSIFAVTGTDGRFCLEDAPAGRIFVHIDGTTASNSPPDSYYPSVGKSWDTISGERIHIGLIHLPAIADTSLQPVSTTQDTEITFSPDQVAMVSDPVLRSTLEDVVVTVPADSLFDDDGSRGGSVGIAPVASDRLPGALPVGLELPLVITVQTDGPTNFDEEAPVCFMNLPDPVDGSTLEAGQTTGLWSFNHDTGRFEVVGQMTATEDASQVCTDPGVGILAPGWHGWADGTEGFLFRPPGAPSCGSAEISALQALKTLGSCAQNISGLGEVVGVIKNLAKQLGRVSKAADGFQSAYDDYRTGDVRRGDVRNAVTQIRSLKGPLSDLVQAANRSASPLGKAVALVDCAEQAVRLAEEPCNQLGDRYFQCRAENASLARLCDAVPALSSSLSIAKRLLQAANLQLKDITVFALCTALDEAEEQLLMPMSSEERLLDALEELANQTNAIPIVTDDEAETLDGFWDDFIDFSNNTGDAAAASNDGGSLPFVKTLGLANDGFVKLEIGRAVQRFRSEESGFYRALMPSERDYALLTYEPSTAQCGVGFGVSARAGERTDFHGPLLGDCIAGDTDGDGLPDIAEDIIGTAVDNPDTDEDGVDDASEVRAGTDPGGRSTIQPRALIEGDLAAPGEVDVWRLAVNEPSRFFHAVLGVVTSAGNLRFVWRGPDGEVLQSGDVSPLDGLFGLPFEAATAGVYTLSISAATTTADGSYRFRVFEPTTETSALLLGEPTAGRIDTPGDIDRWEFDGSAGDELFFDMQELGGPDDGVAFIELYSPSGVRIFNTLSTPDFLQDEGPFTLAETGVHALVFGSELIETVYDYQFVLSRAESAGGGEVAIGTVENGTIEDSGGFQEWTFSATAGERFFFDLIAAEGDGAIFEVELLAPDGSRVVSDFLLTGRFAPASNLGPIDLSQTGTYRLVFRSSVPGTTYSFAVYKPTVDARSVTRGVRTNGEISVPGEVDEWRFSASAGEGIELMIDAVTDPVPELATYTARVFAPSGALLLDAPWIIEDGDAFALLPELTETGTYRFVMNARVPTDFTFRYSFTVPVP